ncbi:hypothetical protein V8C44DRAFT_145656 [Trichoderma aethiopicum]
MSRSSAHRCMTRRIRSCSHQPLRSHLYLDLMCRRHCPDHCLSARCLHVPTAIRVLSLSLSLSPSPSLLTHGRRAWSGSSGAADTTHETRTSTGTARRYEAYTVRGTYEPRRLSGLVSLTTLTKPLYYWSIEKDVPVLRNQTSDGLATASSQRRVPPRPRLRGPLLVAAQRARTCRWHRMAPKVFITMDIQTHWVRYLYIFIISQSISLVLPTDSVMERTASISSLTGLVLHQIRSW